MSVLPSPSNDKQRAVLACCRPDGDDQGDRKLRDALNHLESDASLKASFDTQVDFDQVLGNMVRVLPLPETFNQEVSAGLARSDEQPQFSWRGLLRQPAFWAVLLAFAFMVAWGADVLYQRAVGFPGDEAVIKLIEAIRVAEGSSHQGDEGSPAATRFEPISVESGKMGDLLFLKHNVADFQVPGPFVHAQTISYRVMERNDTPVTQVKVHDRNLTFLVFRAEGFGVDINPAGQWKYLTGEDWSAAAEVTNHVCFIAISPGPKAELETYIQQAEESAR